MTTESQSSAPAASMTPRIFCKACGYALIGLQNNKCPECGQEFDLANRRTFARRPPRSALWRWGQRAAAVMLLLLLAAGTGLMWLWWGWQAEQKTITRLRTLNQKVHVAAIGPERLRWVLGQRLGYLADRVDTALLMHLKAAEVEQLDFRNLAHIEQLSVVDCEMSNSALSNLAGLTKLQDLRLDYVRIKKPDLAFLEKLPALSTLQLMGKWVAETGFEHPWRLQNLKVLDLRMTGMTDADLQQLRSLSSLEKLNLLGNPINGAGLEHLQEVKSLRELWIDGNRATFASVAKLKQAIPLLTIHNPPWNP